MKLLCKKIVYSSRFQGEVQIWWRRIAALRNKMNSDWIENTVCTAYKNKKSVMFLSDILRFIGIDMKFGKVFQAYIRRARICDDNSNISISDFIFVTSSKVEYERRTQHDQQKDGQTQHNQQGNKQICIQRYSNRQKGFIKDSALPCSHWILE